MKLRDLRSAVVGLSALAVLLVVAAAVAGGGAHRGENGGEHAVAAAGMMMTKARSSTPADDQPVGLKQPKRLTSANNGFGSGEAHSGRGPQLAGSVNAAAKSRAGQTEGSQVALNPLQIVLPWTRRPTVNFAGNLNRDSLAGCGAVVEGLFADDTQGPPSDRPSAGVRPAVARRRCVFRPRPSLPAAVSNKGPAAALGTTPVVDPLHAAVAAADVVLLDSIGKMAADLRELGPAFRAVPGLLDIVPPHVDISKWPSAPNASPPHHRRVAMWNTENWLGRMQEWSSKYSVRWLNATAAAGFWPAMSFFASFETTADAFLPYGNHFPQLDDRIADLREKGWRRRRASSNDKLATASPPEAMYVASNCHTRWQGPHQPPIVGAAWDAMKTAGRQRKAMRDRDAFIGELRHAGLVVAAYGACLPNRDNLDARCRAEHGRSNRVKLCTAGAAHDFYLSFENSLYPDYVTEKLYEPLAAGAIPVYMGAPNVAAFAPAAHSIIVGADFATPRALVDYLRCVAANRTLLEYYRGWRGRPRLPTWRRITEVPNLCRVCDAALRANASLSARSHAPAEPSAMVEDALVRDSQKPLPCLLPGAVTNGV